VGPTPLETDASLPSPRSPHTLSGSRQPRCSRRDTITQLQREDAHQHAHTQRDQEQCVLEPAPCVAIHDLLPKHVQAAVQQVGFLEAGGDTRWRICGGYPGRRSPSSATTFSIPIKLEYSSTISSAFLHMGVSSCANPNATELPTVVAKELTSTPCHTPPNRRPDANGRRPSTFETVIFQTWGGPSPPHWHHYVERDQGG
jgi:hypothetical protein